MKIERLTVSWQKKVVLTDFSLGTEPGKILAVLGPNGSGKTTLLKAVAGLLFDLDCRVDGKVFLDEKNIFELEGRERAKKIAYLGSGGVVSFPLSVREWVELGRFPHFKHYFSKSEGQDRISVDEALDVCGLTQLQNRDFRTLSSGEVQLANLARVLAQDAQVLLLDEAFSQLDYQHLGLVVALIRRLSQAGKTFWIVSHDFNFSLSFADYAVVLRQGKMIAHGPAQSVVRQDLLDELYPSAKIFVGKNPKNGSQQIFLG